MKNVIIVGQGLLLYHFDTYCKSVQGIQSVHYFVHLFDNNHEFLLQQLNPYVMDLYCTEVWDRLVNITISLKAITCFNKVK